MDKLKELGVAGIYTSGGSFEDEDAPRLSGLRGLRIYRQMWEQDPTIYSMGAAVTAMLKRAGLVVEAAGDKADAEEAKVFVEGVFEDMSHSASDVLDSILTMLPYGWSALEHVWKRRVGPDQSDSSRRSHFTDGKIGIRKLAFRTQFTLDRWLLDETGGIQGFVQNDPNGSQIILPIDRLLLFRTQRRADTPEGRSVLKACYAPWRNARNVQRFELFAVERELNGVPVIYLPSSIINAAPGTPEALLYQSYKNAVRLMKNNEQGGLILPSDTFINADGDYNSTAAYRLELLSASGSRSIDTGSIIAREQLAMARVLMADFIMLGQSDRGSFALSKSKADLFLLGLEHILQHVADVYNDHLLPRLWRMNGQPWSTMPYMKPGQVAPQDLEELGNYVRAITGAGVTLEDRPTQDHLRQIGGLPEADPEDLLERDLLG